MIVDEAHKLPEAAKQMFGKNLCTEDIREVAYYLEREHQKEEARILRTVLYDALHVVGAEQERVGKESGKYSVIQQIVWFLCGKDEKCSEILLDKLEKCVQKLDTRSAGGCKEVMECSCSSDKRNMSAICDSIQSSFPFYVSRREIHENCFGRCYGIGKKGYPPP